MHEAKCIHVAKLQMYGAKGVHLSVSYKYTELLCKYT